MTEVPGRRNRRALQCAAMGIGGFVTVLGLTGLAGNLDGGDAGGRDVPTPVGDAPGDARGGYVTGL